MKKYLNLISAAVLIILTIIVYKTWIISPVIASGDFWYYFPSMYDLQFLYPYAWYTFSSSGLGGVGYANLNTSIVVSSVFYVAEIFNLSWENATKILFYFPFIALSLAGSTLLIRRTFPKNPFWMFAPIIFLFNSYILMMVGGGQIITALSYSIIPFSILLTINLIEEKNIFSGMNILSYGTFVLLFAFQCVLDIRIAFVTFVAIMIYLIIVAFFKLVSLKSALFLLTSFIVIGILNSYWFIPYLFYGADPIKSLGSNYNSAEIIKFLSFARLENSIGLFHPYWPENIFGKVGFMKVEFFILPILAFSSLLFIDKDQEKKTKIYLLFFLLISLLGIFLGKGANQPLGDVYIWLFNNIPGFQLFRDSFKWYVLIIVGFSILIPYSVFKISEIIKNKDRIFKKSKIINFSNLFVACIFIYFIFLSLPAVSGRLNGTFAVKNVPESYKELNNFLSNQGEYYRTFWVPNTMLFGYYSNSHPQISARDFLKEYDQERIISEIKSSNFQDVLNNASVKYLIVPQDTENEIFLNDRKYDKSKYKTLVNELDKIPWLKKIEQFGNIAIYEVPGNKSHFWCSCGAVINSEFINPTKYKLTVKNLKEGDRIIFSEKFDEGWSAKNENFEINSKEFKNLYNSFNLPPGNHTLEVVYKPQKVIDMGVKITLVGLLILVSVFTYGLVKMNRSDKIKR